MTKSPCRVRNLAADGLCAIEYCQDCELIHLTIGYTTLRIGPEAFLALGETLNTARARFRRMGNTGQEGPETRNRKQLPH